jgi:hypothetical protein
MSSQYTPEQLEAARLLQAEHQANQPYPRGKSISSSTGGSINIGKGSASHGRENSGGRGGQAGRGRTRSLIQSAKGAFGALRGQRSSPQNFLSQLGGQKRNSSERGGTSSDSGGLSSGLETESTPLAPDTLSYTTNETQATITSDVSLENLAKNPDADLSEYKSSADGTPHHSQSSPLLI